jgi:hypothetical protein
MTRTAQIEFEMVIEHDPEAHPNDYLFHHLDYRAEDEAQLEAAVVRRSGGIVFPQYSQGSQFTK